MTPLTDVPRAVAALLKSSLYSISLEIAWLYFVGSKSVRQGLISILRNGDALRCKSVWHVFLNLCRDLVRCQFAGILIIKFFVQKNVRVAEYVNRKYLYHYLNLYLHLHLYLYLHLYLHLHLPKNRYKPDRTWLRGKCVGKVLQRDTPHIEGALAGNALKAQERERKLPQKGRSSTNINPKNV